MEEKIESIEDIHEMMAKDRFEDNLLKAILTSSVTKEDSTIPNVEEYILCEVANGLLSYLGAANNHAINYDARDKAAGYYFEKDVDKLVKDALKTNGSKLQPRMKMHLERMLSHYTAEYDDRCRGSTYESRSRLYLRFRVITYGQQLFRSSSTYSIPYSWISESEKFMGSLSEPEREDIRGIGRELARFRAADVSYVEGHYRW